jgi:hypothetical protein
VIAGICVEVWLAAGYALFLLVAAFVLERLARHCHRRGELIHTAGFNYRHEIDAWECPAGQFLTRAEIDDRWHTIIYRAPARACNTCALKIACTDSDQGREIASQPDGWLRSEIARFHCGISLTLYVLAGLIATVEIVRDDARPERLLLGALLVLITARAKYAVSALGFQGSGDMLRRARIGSLRS